jgi:chitinase
MNHRSGLCGAPGLVAVLLLPACGGGSVGGSPSSAGSSSGGSQVAASGSNSSGAPTSGSTGAASGTATSGGATGSTSPEAGGPILAEAGDANPGEGGAASTSDGGGVSGSSMGDGSAGNSGTPDTKVVMYLPNWSGSFSTWATKIDFNKMTHLNLAFGVVRAGTNDWSLGAADADVKALAAAAHAKNVKILVSIGGASDDIGIINQYQTQSNIAPLVANLDAFVTRLDLDGVDVDLERGSYMKATGNFPAFVNKVVSTFRPEGKLVTTALAQYIVQDAGGGGAGGAALNAVLASYDFINLMIYSTNMNTYTNELNWWSANTGLPKTKLVWGVDFSPGKLTAAMAKQLTTASKAYGGIMVWEYSLGGEAVLWPAIQGAI